MTDPRPLEVVAHGSVHRRWWLLALATTAAAIVVVTFPWDLQDHAHWYKVSWVPFTGVVRLRDLVGNAIGYVPVGFFLARAFPATPRTRLIGVALSMSALLEFAQIWSHVRFPSATDLLLNGFGAAVGISLTRSGRRR
jgi:glycopeptide antibiotics resistance protein